MGGLEDYLSGDEAPVRRETLRDLFLDMLPFYGDKKMLREQEDRSLAVRMIRLKYTVLSCLGAICWVAYEAHQYFEKSS